MLIACIKFADVNFSIPDLGCATGADPAIGGPGGRPPPMGAAHGRGGARRRDGVIHNIMPICEHVKYKSDVGS